MDYNLSKSRVASRINTAPACDRQKPATVLRCAYRYDTIESNVSSKADGDGQLNLAHGPETKKIRKK